MKRGTYDYSKVYRVFHKHGTLLESGWYDTQTWGALNKAWLGYVIAKNKGEYDKQIQYASIIQKLQRELDLEVSCFPQLFRIDLSTVFPDTFYWYTQLLPLKHCGFE